MSSLGEDNPIVLEVIEGDAPGFTDAEAYAFLAGIYKPAAAFTAAANAGFTTGMVALVPSDADIARLAVEDGEAPEQLHLTLAFLGEMANVTPEARAEILKIAERYAGSHVAAEAFSVNVFNPKGDDPCVVLGVGNGGPELAELQSNITSALRGMGGFSLPEQHTPWVPHVTLAYTDDAGRAAELVDRTGPVTFDKLRVAFGDEVTDIPLGAPLGDGEANEIMVSAAEAGRIMKTLANDRGLRTYWTRGAGAAKIRWGTDGSFDRCVRQLRKYVARPQGLCAEYHKEATGEWPAEKGIESAMKPLVAHGTHNQDDHGNWADPGHNPPNVRKVRSDGPESVYDEMTDDAADEFIERLRDAAGIPGIGDRLKTRLEQKGLNDLRKVARKLGLNVQPTGEWKKTLVSEITDHLLKSQGNYSADTLTAANDGTADEPWEGILTVEGAESGDGRMFALGSLDWATLPLPLMYQPANVGGHNASVLIGEITHAARKKSDVFGWGNIFGAALAGEHGEGIRQMMKTGGVSVDVDNVKDADVEMVYADGDTGVMAKPETTIFHRGRIRGATLVAFPAFVEAKLHFTGEAMTASVESCGCGEPEVLVAGTHTITLADLPPKSWFDKPTDVKMYGALTVTDEGRVFGRLAPSNTTHRSVKRRVPMRTVDYSRWMNKETIVEGGERIVTGVITMNCGHAPTDVREYGTLENRKSHYDNSCSIAANVRIGEDADGVWVAGSLRHGITADQVATMMGCQLSGDWQPHPDRAGITEFVAALLVPVPGFPMARSQASVQYQDGTLVASAVPVQHISDAPQLSPLEKQAWAAIESAKRHIMTAAGLDPDTLKAMIMSELEE